ncbi:hypothetical protein BC936DRAFT_147309 [Jimgerdemannia flammicorona]|uniref:BLOC-1-related complex subunit 7 n=1 Tax=Jimgerdemannia flammicorona TaxID=994334 RepID=A0A433D5K8_9FUNG|nr:hypothetical protein BC936DRAFT_147309 [Jimgerdemannia flammicorona]
MTVTTPFPSQPSPTMKPSKSRPNTPTSPTFSTASASSSRSQTPVSQSPRPSSLLVTHPGLLAAAMGAQATIEDPLQASKQDIREQARSVLDGWGGVAKTVTRTADVSEELYRNARALGSAEVNIKSTQQSLDRLNAMLTQLHDRHNATLDHLHQITQIQDSLKLSGLVEKIRAGDSTRGSVKASAAVAVVSADTAGW